MIAINWINSHKWEVILLLVVVMIGGFLRFYNVGDYMFFGTDEGNHAFMVRSIARDGDVQLLGPSIAPGDKAFSLGPFYYYLLVPAYWLTGNDPAAGAFMVALFSFLSVGLMYYIMRIWYGPAAALSSTFLYSVSWLMVYYGRWIWNPNFMSFFILALIICLHYVIKARDGNKQWWLYGAAFFTATATQLHGTALFILPIFLLLFFLYFRPKIRWWQYLIALTIILITYLPWLIYDLRNDFENIRGVFSLVTGGDSEALGWVGVIKLTFNKFYDFYHLSLMQSKIDIVFLITFASAVAVAIYNLINFLKKKTKDISAIVILLWLFVPFVVFFFYRDYTPPHYFCVVFPLSFMLVGGLIHFLSRIKWLRIIALVLPLLLGSVALFHSVTLLSDLHLDGTRSSTYEVTLGEMRQVVDYIIEQEADKRLDFISVPANLLGRGYDYLLDQESFTIVSTDEEFKYLAVYGNDPDIDSLIQNDELVNWQRYGQAIILKIKKHPDTEDVL